MVPPLPAASRPSNTIITRSPLCFTQSCNLHSSACSRRNSFSYFFRLSALSSFDSSFCTISASLLVCERALPAQSLLVTKPTMLCETPEMLRLMTEESARKRAPPGWNFATSSRLLGTASGRMTPKGTKARADLPAVDCSRSSAVLLRVQLQRVPTPQRPVPEQVPRPRPGSEHPPVERAEVGASFPSCAFVRIRRSRGSP